MNHVWVAIVYGRDVIEGVYTDLDVAVGVARDRHRDDWPVYLMSVPVDTIPPPGHAPTNGLEGGSWYPAVQPTPEWAIPS